MAYRLAQRVSGYAQYVIFVREKLRFSQKQEERVSRASVV